MLARVRVRPVVGTMRGMALWLALLLGLKLGGRLSMNLMPRVSAELS